MTEPELILALTNASVDARAVVAMLQQYAKSAGDVTLTLSNGNTYTLPGVLKQQNGFAAQNRALKIALTQDFGGAVAGMVLNRDAYGVLQSVVTTFTSGYTLRHDYTRSGSTGLMASILVTVKDELANTLVTVTKTINRSNSLVTSIT
jgi:hypothetical protein